MWSIWLWLILAIIVAVAVGHFTAWFFGICAAVIVGAVYFAFRPHGFLGTKGGGGGSGGSSGSGGGGSLQV